MTLERCDNRVDPGGFGIHGGFQLGGAVCSAQAITQAMWRDLDVDEVREVHGETGLGDAFDEAVRKAVDIQAMQGAHAVAPTCR